MFQNIYGSTLTSRIENMGVVSVHYYNYTLQPCLGKLGIVEVDYTQDGLTLPEHPLIQCEA